MYWILVHTQDYRGMFNKLIQSDKDQVYRAACKELDIRPGNCCGEWLDDQTHVLTIFNYAKDKILATVVPLHTGPIP